MTKFTHWTPDIKDDTEHDPNDSYIVKSWEHDYLPQTVLIFHEPERDFERPYHIEVTERDGSSTHGTFTSKKEAKRSAGQLLDDHPRGIGDLEVPEEWTLIIQADPDVVDAGDAVIAWQREGSFEPEQVGVIYNPDSQPPEGDYEVPYEEYGTVDAFDSYEEAVKHAVGNRLRD